MSMSSQVETFLREHPDTDFTAEQMAEATGLSRIQVQSGVSQLRSMGLYVHSPHRGIYRFEAWYFEMLDELAKEGTAFVPGESTKELERRADIARQYVADVDTYVDVDTLIVELGDGDTVRLRPEVFGQ